MAKRVLAAKLEVYNPANGSLKKSLTTNLGRVEIREVSRDSADDAGFDVLHNFADLSDISTLDEVRFYVQTEDDADLVHTWTGTIDDIDVDREGPDFAVLPIKAQDWVYFRMARTFVSNAWVNKSAGAILRSVLSGTGIDSTNVENTSTTIASFVARDESVLSIARRLAEHAGAEFRGDKDKALHFFERRSKSSGLSVSPSSVKRGSFRVRHTASGFGNTILIRGGSRLVEDQANENAVNTYDTLSGSTRREVRVAVSKDEIREVHLYTDPDTPSQLNGSLTVRIQADNEAGTAPVDVDDVDSDLASVSLGVEDLTDDGWTTFRMPSHIVPPGGYAWVIVESDSQTQRVAVDGADAMLFRTHFGVPIVVRRTDASSVAKYGTHELEPITDTSIVSESDAEALGDAVLLERKNPPVTGGYEVQDMALSAVDIGETVSATFTKDGVPASTALVVTEKRHVYDGALGTYSLSHRFTSADNAIGGAQVVRALAGRVKRVEDALWESSAIAFFAPVADSLIVSDSVTATEDATGSAQVDQVNVGFFSVG